MSFQYIADKISRRVAMVQSVAHRWVEAKSKKEIINEALQEKVKNPDTGRDVRMKTLVNKKDKSPKQKSVVENFWKKLKEEHNLDVRDKDKNFAEEVSKNISEGADRIQKDFCKLPQEFCRDNLGVSRIDMPVIEPSQMEDFKSRLADGLLNIKKPPATGKATKDYLDGKGDKVKITNKKMPVTQLKATQKEINASKAQGMADAAKLGKFDPSKATILVSKDGYILDGHHRWAALQIMAKDPDIKEVPKMNVVQVDLPVKKLLQVANAYTDAVGNARKPFED